MKKLISRMLIIVDSLIRNIINKFIKCEPNKNILIVFQQVFGDSVLIQKSLFEYGKIFPNEDGYKIKMLVRPAVHKFMSETMPLPSDIEFVDVDFKLFLEDYKYYRCIIQEYTRNYSVIIVPGSSFSAEVFTTACNSNRKIGLVRSNKIKKPLLMALFNRIAYTERVVSDDDDMIIQRHRQLIHYLGGTDYVAELSELKKKDRVIDEEFYCVLCVGASVAEKCWPIERFAKVADYIIDQYGLAIHICGGKEDAERVKQLKKLANNSSKIFSHVGNTTFSEWSSIIQYASLLVTNDSATAHIGAAARVKTVCITGVYDGSYIFPYKVDCLSEYDVIPNSVSYGMPCKDCRATGYFIGSTNIKCREQIRSGKCTLCIDAISYDNVIALIDNLIK